ncbi:hypothetical protein [Domibacillus sp.]|uniref:hypothetical protein n=1 Tax=Domibacillus sp. TaxID=1969783 RepID=UPI0028111538|nr:hypothetical protein [Domibacillus sp.]
MKKYYIFYSIICLFVYFSIPFLMMTDVFFYTFGEFSIFSMGLFPLLGILCALLGKRGRAARISIMLNSLAFCFLFLLVVLRTGVVSM